MTPRKAMKPAFLLLAIFLVTACGVPLRSNIRVPELLTKVSAVPGSGSFVFVDGIIDSRDRNAVVVVEGRDVMPSNDVVPVVTDGLKRALSSKGIDFAETAPIILTGEIKTWRVDVEGSMQKKARCEAALRIEVLDPANKRVYSGTYKGFAAMESPTLGEKDVQEALRTGMSEAIKQVVSDQTLINTLRSF